jgi:hypothetical protein
MFAAEACDIGVYDENLSQWRTATGNAATVASATFCVAKYNKAEKIP